jgi:Leucine-rich repeat (LRR) protein
MVKMRYIMEGGILFLVLFISFVPNKYDKMNNIYKQLQYYITTKLDLSNKNLTELPRDIHKYKNLIFLDCSNNQLTNLPKLPFSLKILYCNGNRLTNLPRSLPSGNRLSARSALELPSSLQILWCANNELPSSLKELYCNLKMLIPIHNNLTEYLEKETCCICWENNCNAKSNCSHIFCKSCIVNSIKKYSSCPLCRQEILAIETFSINDTNPIPQ